MNVNKLTLHLQAHTKAEAIAKAENEVALFLGVTKDELKYVSYGMRASANYYATDLLWGDPSETGRWDVTVEVDLL